MGLPTSGKTTLAIPLSAVFHAVHFNADEVRENINSDLGFSEQDRNTQAKRMGWLCDQVNKAGHNSLADFVCPTEVTREMFGKASLIVWMNTIEKGPYENTNKIFEAPHEVLTLTEQDNATNIRKVLAELNRRGLF
jgi:hypothetical protein